MGISASALVDGVQWLSPIAPALCRALGSVVWGSAPDSSCAGSMGQRLLLASVGQCGSGLAWCWQPCGEDIHLFSDACRVLGMEMIGLYVICNI